MIKKGQVSLVRTYAYDRDLYTQGLEVFSPNEVLISAGRYGASKLGLYQLDEERFDIKKQFPETIFAEGLTLVTDFFWLLTYKEGLAYDNNENCLWMTSCNAYLQKRDPQDFSLLETVLVAIDGVPISMLNELEYVDGYLYANIWQTTTIVKLLPASGQVVATYDLGFLLDQLKLNKENYPDLDVLNGITHLSDNRFLVSGKLYPLMLEVVLED
ncbi:glutaminyl-peptide cyclotransferase [Streptococcus ictaluri]|uniref:Glutamine cyclotransferase domain protein n=1 Tax=Streptococcus ictaluri 707-05 TaxID=764299 RepID=G5K1V9_9STRE|nr:glutaminyl-peptide cyclotransferase [Streptococcus ictaluri]EHI70193.1 glutamine cyclotransferase domain protein [Streptococcus ictaluri 707-05]